MKTRKHAAEYSQGFRTQPDEVTLDALPVTGTIPSWLAGTLIRNGPGQFELPDRAYNHWFDGLAMLHRFTLREGRVSYANRFLQSQDYQQSTTSGEVHLRAFATDPCMSVFKRVMTLFDNNMTDNANINVVKWAGRFIALTESPFAVEFDPVTLETTAHRNFNDHVLHRAATTAHPHMHPSSGTTYNFAVRFNVPSSAYRVYAYDPRTDTRRIVGDIPVRNPAYIHSFGITERYAVIAAYPLTVSVPDLAFSGKAFIENYHWQPDTGTRFYLMHLQTGDLAGEFQHPEPVFAFHHVNAFEEGDTVQVDLVTYPDTRAIDGLYLERVRQGDRSVIPAGQLHRYHLGTTKNAVRREVLSGTYLELPRINDAYNTRPYRYVYGASANPTAHTGFPDQIAKVDIQQGATRIWEQPGCYPGEPIFVPQPGSTAEDAGVVLSIVLDTAADCSFLLVLDAGTLEEVGRATVPQHIPFGFHGQFYDGVGG